MNYYVRLVQGKGLISRLIEFHSADWPSHVELLRTDDQDNPESVLSSRYPGGVALRGYNDYPVVMDRWYKATCADLAWQTMVTLIGHKYDLLDIFGISFDTDWHRDGNYICSEAVAFAFEHTPIPLFNLNEEVRRIIPAHFLLTPMLNLYKAVQ